MTNILKSFTESVKNWYIPLILGIIFILFGIYIFTVPVDTYVTLSVLFSITFIVTGISDIIFGIRNSKILNGWGWHLVSGILLLIIGIYLLASPEVSRAVLPFVVGFTLLFRSFHLLVFSLDLRDSGILSWGNLAIVSVISICLSIMLIINPRLSGLSLVTLTGLSFIFVGIGCILLSLNLKKIKDYPKKIDDETKRKIEDLQNDIDEAMRFS